MYIVCPLFSEGEHCQIPSTGIPQPLCQTDLDCGGHGHCITSGNSRNCSCDVGYSGDKCEIQLPSDYCSPHLCNYHGNCSIDGMLLACVKTLIGLLDLFCVHLLLHVDANI